MNKKIKAANGITLIALILTIIILLILAVVTIKAVQGDGIITHAKNAKIKYTEAQEDEKVKLATYNALLSGHGKVEKQGLIDELIAQGLEGAKVEAGTEKNTFIVTLASGRKYKVSTTGTVTKIAQSGDTKEYEYTLAEIKNLAQSNGEYREQVDEESGKKALIMLIPFSTFWREGTPDDIKNGIPSEDSEMEGYFFGYNVTVENYSYSDMANTGNEPSGKSLCFLAITPEVANNGLGMAATEMSILVMVNELEDSDDLTKIKIKIKEPDNTSSGEDDSNPISIETLEKYIYGPDGDGRDWQEILNTNTWTFLQDPNDSNSNIHKSIKFCTINNENDIQIRCNRDIYKFTLTLAADGETAKTQKGSLKKVRTPERNLGKYVKYKNIDWIVLYDDDTKVELISADVLGKVTLGASSATDFSGSKESYNNAINTLTQACKNATGISDNIRNVGGPASEDVASAKKLTLNSLKEKGFTVNEKTEESKIVDLIKDIIAEDDNYSDDNKQMDYLGITNPDSSAGGISNGSYWLSSRQVGLTSLLSTNYVSCSMRFIQFFNIEPNTQNLMKVSEYAGTNASSRSLGIRPVVSLSSGILEGKNGAGTIEDPIIIK